MILIANVPHHANYYFMLANKLINQQVTDRFYYKKIIRKEMRILGQMLEAQHINRKLKKNLTLETHYSKDLHAEMILQ